MSGEILLVLDHIEADYYATAVTQCAVAAVICLADMVIGIVGEWLCQLPPMEGPENPKMKAAKTPPRHRLRHRQNPPLSPFPLAGGAA